MSELFRTQYRINRDWFDSRFWMVERRVWFWPFWTEACGLLNTLEEAREMVRIYRSEPS